MEQTGLLLMTVIGPALLLIIIAWIAVRPNGGRRTVRRSERATHQLYLAEERRRRDGTDRL